MVEGPSLAALVDEGGKGGEPGTPGGMRSSHRNDDGSDRRGAARLAIFSMTSLLASA